MKIEYDELVKSLAQDFGLSKEEVEIFELDPLLRELENLIKDHKKWFQQPIDCPATHSSILPKSSSKVFSIPMGTVLILSNKKFELQTIIHPLITSLAAGNYTVVLPEIFSNNSDPKGTHTFKTIKRLVEKYISPERVLILDPSTSLDELVESKRVDMIYDCRTWKGEIGQKAVERGIEYVKYESRINISIVDKHADVVHAARMLADFKYYKSGQDFNNLDTIYIDESIYQEFISAFKLALFYERTVDGPSNFQHGRILNEEIFEKIEEALINEKLETSGIHPTSKANPDKLFISPILIKDPSPESSLFVKKHNSPVLPIVTFTSLNNKLEELSSLNNLGSIYYYGGSTGIFQDLKSILSYRQLYYNSTGQLGRSAILPSFSQMSGSASTSVGIFGFQTFTRSKLFGVFPAREHKIIGGSFRIISRRFL